MRADIPCARDRQVPAVWCELRLGHPGKRPRIARASFAGLSLLLSKLSLRIVVNQLGVVT